MNIRRKKKPILLMCLLIFSPVFSYFAEINQPIRPAELPIIGDPYTEISLDLLFPTKTATFALIGKKIQLTQPLDRDAENLSHIVFQVIIP